MLLQNVAEQLKKTEGYEEIPTADILVVVRDCFKVVRDLAVKEGMEFALQIPKFGTFKIIETKPRVGHNPKTNEKMNIPAKARLKFKPSSNFQKAIAENHSPAPKKAAKKKKKKS